MLPVTNFALFCLSLVFTCQFVYQYAKFAAVLKPRQIQAKFNPEMVLSVSMKNQYIPPSQGTEGGATSQLYLGCPVMLQRAKKTQFGRANQKWRFDQETGLIYAFATDTMDKGNIRRLLKTFHTLIQMNIIITLSLTVIFYFQ